MSRTFSDEANITIRKLVSFGRVFYPAQNFEAVSSRHLQVQEQQ